MKEERRVHLGRDRHWDRGSVTVEFALALPVVAVVLPVGIVGVVAVDGQGRSQTAAAVAARAVARGDEPAARQGLAQAEAESVRVERAAGLVCVHAGRPAGTWPFCGIVLRGDSCAADEAADGAAIGDPS